VVTDRPVIAQAIVGLDAEVDRREAQRDPPPMVCSSSHDARTKPAEVRAGRRRVRLTLDGPRTRRCDELILHTISWFQRVSGYARATAGKLVGPNVLFEILHRVQPRPGLKHDDVQPAFGENLGSGSPPCSRSNNANVIHLRRTADLRHEESSPTHWNEPKSAIIVPASRSHV